MKKYFFYLFCLLTLFTSCHKKKTIWESDWTVPIVNDTLSFDKYVKNQIINSVSGYYELNFNRTLIDFNLTEIVKIPDTTINKSFTIPFSNFNLAPGTSFVNSVEEHPMNVQAIELKKVRLSNGVINLKLENPVNTPVFFKIQLIGVSKDGNEFEKIYKVPSGSILNPGIIENTVDISGYDLNLSGITGGTFNILQSKFTVTTDPDGINTSITDKHITKVSAQLKDLKVDYARGYFGDKIISDTIETTVDFLTKIQAGSVDFPESKLKFIVTNGLKIPAKATITSLKNSNVNGSTVPLNLTTQSAFQFGEAFNLDPATGSWSTLSESKKEIEFNSTNSNLEKYLENLGAIQKIGYSIHLNPWGNTSGGWNEFFPSSRLKVEINASMPLSFELDKFTLKNTFTFEVKQNTEKTHVVSGGLTLFATNGFPISGKIILELLDSDGDVLFLVEGTEILKSSEFGNSFSKGIKIANSTIHFVLTKEMVKKLEMVKKVNVISQFDTPSSFNNQNIKVQIPEGAFLGVKLKGDFKVENRF